MTESPSDAEPSPAVAEALRAYKAIPQLSRLRDEVLFGDVWEQPEMNRRDRSLVTCAALAVMGRQDELAVHIGRAIANGVTLDELRGMSVQLAFYAGWPVGLSVGRAALPFIEQDSANAESRDAAQPRASGDI